MAEDFMDLMWSVVVNGQKGQAYDAFFHGNKLVWDTPDSLHDLARRRGELLRVEVKIVKY